MPRSMIFMWALCSGESSGMASPRPGRAGYQVAAAGVSLVQLQKERLLSKNRKKHRVRTPSSSLPQRGTARGPARRKSAAPEPVDIRNLTLAVSFPAGCEIALCSPRKASFFLPALPFLVRTGKARSSSRPCTAGTIGAPGGCQNGASWRRDRRFFAPSLAKNTGPAFDRRGRGDILAVRRGAALLNEKLQPEGLSEFPFLQHYTHALWTTCRFKKDSLVEREFKSLRAGSY